MKRSYQVIIGHAPLYKKLNNNSHNMVRTRGIFRNFQPLTVFAKISIVDFRLGSKCASENTQKNDT